MLIDKKLTEGVNFHEKLIGSVNFLAKRNCHVEAKVDGKSLYQVYSVKNYQLSGTTPKVDSELTAKLTHCPKCKSRVNSAWKRCPDCNIALRTEKWTPDDWQYFCNERAGILEHDGKYSRAEAERIAYQTCIIRWMNENPPTHNDINTCPPCQKQNNQDSIPVLKKGGHIWLHDKCHAGWLESRKQEAMEALAKIGIMQR